MVTEELLGKINDGLDKVEELNAELATSLYGGDTGYRGYYDEFWDAYQDYGNRTHYAFGFGGAGWNNELFKPKYDIRPTDANRLFCLSAITGDLGAQLDGLGITLDTSLTKELTCAFQSIKMDRIGAIDLRSATNLMQTFSYNSVLRIIDKLMVNETTPFQSNTFQGSVSIVSMTIEGTIGVNFNVQWSKKLNRASIESIITALSPNTSGLAVTFSKEAVNNAFETALGKADGTSSAEWLALVATKPNWTISLANA